MTLRTDSPTILIVDDTPSNLSVVVNLFEDRGYRVAIAQDGEEGLKRAQLVLPDLILLDVMMPGIDGFETCRRLKAQESTRDIPVIFMTALAATEHKVSGFEVGGVDYVTKPLQIDEVMARVGTHLKLHAAQKRLEEQNAQLEQNREQLEQRVAERTAELGEANRRLREEIEVRERAYRRMELLDFALDHVSEDVSLIDQHGMFRYVNEQACRMQGHPRETLLGMGVPDIDPDWTKERYAAFWLELRERGAITLETRHCASDGRIFPVEVDANYFEYEGVGYNLTLVRDITERKRAERELHLLNHALDNAFDATYLIDEDMRLRYANEAAVRALGYSREELLSMTLSDIDPNLKPEMLKLLMEQTDTLGRFPGIVETQHRRKDGSVFPIEVGATVFDYEGERLHLTTVRDITERKLAEDALRASEEKYRKLISKIRAAVVVHGADTQVLISNPVAQEILGLTEEQLQGKIAIDPAWHFFREDAIPMSQEDYPVNKVLASRQPLSNYVMGIHRPAQAEDVWVLVNAVPVFGQDGAIAQVIVTFTDITQLKHAEAALVARERELRAERGLFVGGPTVVFKWKAKEGWPVEYVSPNIADQLGYAPEDLTSGKFLFSAIVHPDDIARVSEEVSSYTAAGKSSYEQVYRIAHANGDYRWIYDFTVVIRGEGGEVEYYHGYMMDITELKRAERELEESRAQLRGLTARREEVREEERKYIAREVHDELGQILTGLQLNVSVLLHKFAADASPLRDQLQETMQLTDRALGVARNVASALRPAALDMGIVSALEWLAARFSLNTGIKCEVHVEELEIPLDEPHAIALFRIVQESLTNIARHAQASRADISLIRDGDEYSLKVRDNGAGFDQKMKKADSFGLVGMRERALLLGGEVIINSKPGEGTEVEVRIPAHQTEELL